METNVLLQLGVGGIFAILVIDRVLKFVASRNGKLDDRGPTRVDLRTGQIEILRAHRDSVEVLAQKMDEQTRLLTSIDKTQALTYQAVENLKSRGL